MGWGKTGKGPGEVKRLEKTEKENKRKQENWSILTVLTTFEVVVWNWEDLGPSGFGSIWFVSVHKVKFADSNVLFDQFWQMQVLFNWTIPSPQ